MQHKRTRNDWQHAGQYQGPTQVGKDYVLVDAERTPDKKNLYSFSMKDPKKSGNGLSAAVFVAILVVLFAVMFFLPLTGLNR